MKQILFLTLAFLVTSFSAQGQDYFSKVQTKLTGKTERQSCEASAYHLHQLSMQAAVSEAMNFCEDKEGLDSVRLIKQGIYSHSYDYTDICKYKRAWSQVHVTCHQVTGPRYPSCQVPSPYCRNGCCDRE